MAPAEVEGVGQHVQAFLDEWHYRMVHTKMVKNMDRPKALGMALDMLECSGLKYPTATFKDELLAQREEEDSIVGKLVEIMPQAMKESFDAIALELQNALHTSAALREAVDADQEQSIHNTFEASADSPLACEYILRKATLQAAVKATKVRRCHASWRQNMEDRIERLMHTQEDAENANSQLFSVQEQLDMFGESQNAKAKGMLSNMFAKKDKALLNTSFLNWLQFMQKSKAENKIREKFQLQLEEAEKALFTAKERQLATIKKVFARNVAAEGDNLRAMVVAAWKKVVEDTKADGDTAEQIKAAKAKLDSMREGQTASAKKVLMNMSAGSENVLLTSVWQAWQTLKAENQKDRELEEAMKEAERKFKEHMASKKDEAKRVMERMQGSSNSGLLALCMQNWNQLVVEEVKEREKVAKLKQSEDKFKSLKLKQGMSAKGVQGRTNELMNMNLLLKCFSNWLVETKMNHVEAHFVRKMESKRRQLQGVQTLFKTFAAQLEQGLGDGDASSRGNSGRDSTYKSHRKKGRDDVKGGMTRGAEGSVSLPDIHGGRAYPDDRRY